jgi:hypothetical protein
MNKVAAERNVLSIVNARFRDSDQLAGLSKAAIELWQRKMGSKTSNDVVATLIVLAELCQSLSDRSHESFRPLNPTLDQDLIMALNTLNDLLIDI